jgi:hypothetical protein
VHETGEATTPNLKVVSLMELVDEEEVKDGALPSRTRSSDHIAIAAKFMFAPCTKLERPVCLWLINSTECFQVHKTEPLVEDDCKLIFFFIN